VLLAGVTGAITVTAAFALADEAGRPPGRTRVTALAAPRPRPAPADPASRPAAARPDPGAAVVAAASLPVWARPWRSPISWIDDFTRRCPDVHFPRRAVMLTIDDGPSAEWTPRYLRLLAKHHVRATFCMIGEQVHPNRHVARAVAADGHVIANHTWTHDEQLPSRSAARIRSEIERTSHAIHDATGFVPTQYRAPGGSWGPRVYAEISRQRMMPLGWDIDPRDWARPGTAAIESAMLRAQRHDIILCHDGGGDRSQTYRALQTVIPRLQRRGYEFVTLPAPQSHPKSVRT
jgi:peptidoglycan/xylan/chitin deacetylase (PgdA/CDA1 family)